jgi:glycosyltransferase involved in cell wall biosynthesis
MIRLSVIVPTRNRRDVLMSRALPAMFSQQMRADEFEIIVVVDGSTDGTAAALRELRPPCSLIIIEQPGCGASSARNAGIQAALGHLLLFVDDDIVCEPDVFLRHVEAHQGVEPVLAYGVIAIHPETPPSVMKFGTESWYRDYYSGLEARGGLRLPEDNFLISNSSVPRATVIECGSFDERMTAKEDYELGLRLWKKGVQFKFLPQAKAYEFFSQARLLRRRKRWEGIWRNRDSALSQASRVPPIFKFCAHCENHMGQTRLTVCPGPRAGRSC